MTTIKLCFCCALLTAACATAGAAEFKQASECVVGSKVADRKNNTGTVTSVDGTTCRVRLEEGGKDTSYIFWMLRPAGTKQVPTDRLVTGVYPCYAVSSGTLNYLFMDIQIDGPDTYRDKKGTRGRYRLDAPTGKITFESGPLSKANAKLLAGPKIGLNMDGGSFFNASCSLKK